MALPRVAVFLGDAAMLDAGLPGLPGHGANIGTGMRLRAVVADPRWGGLDVFLPVWEVRDRERLAGIAGRILPAGRRGIGALAFYPHQSAPEVLNDGHDRVIVCVDPEDLPATRYVRDRFARGPAPIATLTHGLGHIGCHQAFARLADAPPAPDALLCLSRALRDAVAALFETLPGGPYPLPFALDHVPNGVDADRFRPADPARRAALRGAFGLPDTDVVGVFQGRVTAHGKADLLPLLHAFHAIGPRPGERLWIVGGAFPDGYRDALAGEAGRIGIGDRVSFHPGVPVDRRQEPLATADFFVLPSDTVQEAHPNAVGEALATGLPALLSDWDGLRDWIDDGVEGFLVPTWIAPAPERIEGLSPWSRTSLQYLLHAGCVSVDVDGLATGLSRLFREPALRSEMGRAARLRARELTWESTFELNHRVFSRLLDLARAEPESARALRREHCERLGPANRYRPVFDHYATHRLDDPRWRVRLSERGRAVGEGRERLSFHDDLLAILNPEILAAVSQRLESAGEFGKSVTALVDEVSKTGTVRPDDVVYHLSLLLKQGIVQVRDTGPGNG